MARNKNKETIDTEPNSVELLATAISHPLTSIPLVCGFLSMAYAIVGAPFLGGFLPSLAFGSILGVTGLANGLFRFFKGQTAYDDAITKQMEEKLQEDRKKSQQWTQQTLATLKADFSNFLKASKNDYTKYARNGLREIGGVQVAFDSTMKDVNSARQNTKFTFDLDARIIPTIKDVFDQGLQLLCNVRDLINLGLSESEIQLTQEISDLKKDIKELENCNGEYNTKSLEIKQKSLQYKQSRLDNLVNNRDLIVLLLSRVDECENTLRRAQDDLIKIRAESTDESMDTVLAKLEDCVRLAVEVRKQIKRESGVNV